MMPWQVRASGRRSSTSPRKRVVSGPSSLSVLFNQEATERLRAFRRVAVTLGSLHDRAFHQDVPGEGEPVGVAQSGLEREVANDGANVLEVVGARSADGVLEVAELEQDVDEGAAFEIVAVEPLVEQIEDRKQLRNGGREAVRRRPFRGDVLRLDRASCPPCGLATRRQGG